MIKVVAAMSSFFPLFVSLEQWNVDIPFANPVRKLQNELKQPILLLGLAIGSGYAASGDMRASFVACVIAATILMLHQDIEEKIESKTGLGDLTEETEKEDEAEAPTF